MIWAKKGNILPCLLLYFVFCVSCVFSIMLAQSCCLFCLLMGCSLYLRESTEEPAAPSLPLL